MKRFIALLLILLIIIPICLSSCNVSDVVTFLNKDIKDVFNFDNQPEPTSTNITPSDNTPTQPKDTDPTIVTPTNPGDNDPTIVDPTTPIDVDPTVTDEKSSDNSIASIFVNEINVDISNLSKIYISLPYDVSTATININANNAKAIVTAPTSKLLIEGNNNVDFTITAENGNVKNYTLIINKQAKPLSNDVSLKAIVVNETNVDITNLSNLYVSVSNDITTATISITANDNKAVVTAPATTDLVEGNNNIDFTITAENGDKQSYTLTIYRQSKVLSNDTTILSVTVNDKVLDITNLAIFFPFDVSNATIVITAVDSAHVEYLSQIELAEGTNTLHFTVVAEDGTTRNESITITREAKILSGDNSISSILVNGQTVDLSKMSISFPYETTVANIVVNIPSTASIGTFTPVSLPAIGKYPIKFNVIAENGSSKEYTLTITREGRTDCSLKSITINDIPLDLTLATPTTNVPYETNTLSIGIIVGDGASYKYTKKPTTLIVGTNTFTILVTAEDNKTTASYTFTVKRLQKAKNSNANLSELSAQGITFNEPFSSSTLSYTATVPYDFTRTSITAKLEDSKASFTIRGASPALKTGHNIFYIDVVAENGTTKQTYTVNIERQAHTGGVYTPTDDVYHYYNQLTTTQKAAYDAMYTELAVNYATEFTIPYSFNDTKAAYSAIYKDHKEIFWTCGAGFSGNTTQTKVTIQLRDVYQDIPSMSAAVNAKVNAIVAEAKKQDTLFDIVLYVHDYLVDNAQYDTAKAAANAPINDHIYTPYGCLVLGKCVCEGYAGAFAIIMQKLGIDCGVITGLAASESSPSGERHAWNYVCLDDEYYIIDVTWDDPIYKDSNGKIVPTKTYNYFLLTSAEANTYRLPDSDSYSPNCTGTKYNYYKYNNLYFETYNTDELCELLKNYSNVNTISLRFKDLNSLNQAKYYNNYLVKAWHPESGHWTISTCTSGVYTISFKFEKY